MTQLDSNVLEQLRKEQARITPLEAQIATIEARNRDLDAADAENTNGLVAMEADIAELKAIAERLKPVNALIAVLRTPEGAQAIANGLATLLEKVAF